LTKLAENAHYEHVLLQLALKHYLLAESTLYQSVAPKLASQDYSPAECTFFESSALQLAWKIHLEKYLARLYAC